MIKLSCAAFLSVLLSLTGISQTIYSLSGVVKDEHQQPLPGATVIITPGDHQTITSSEGFFNFTGLEESTYSIFISFVGHKNYLDTIRIQDNITLQVQMDEKLQTLQEIVVKDHHAERRKKEVSLGIEVVNEEYLSQNMGGSLAGSLERLPGIHSMKIGSGQSKPMIRGLGFNRVVVVDNGIKHQGQQWGGDHGLEIDQFGINQVEIIKGPSSLMHGSDAIGGILDLKRKDVPARQTYGGNISLLGKFNNQHVRSSSTAYL